MGEWSDTHGSQATVRKTFIGQGIKYYPKSAIAEFRLDSHSLEVGEKILITGPTTGVVELMVEELRVDNQPVTHVKKGVLFTTPVAEIVRPSDKLYKLTDIRP